MKTLIVDDDAAIRQGLRCIVEGLGAQIVAEAADGAAAIECAKKWNPDLMLLDISMPGMSGLAAARAVHKLIPQIAIVLVSQHSERMYAEEAMRTGARGFVVKRHAVTELAAALPVIMAGETFISPSITPSARKFSA